MLLLSPHGSQVWLYEQEVDSIAWLVELVILGVGDYVVAG